MFYIHQSACITHQQTLGDTGLDKLKPSADNKMYAIEPARYPGIPIGQLRRMGKAVRMGVGAGLSLALEHKLDGIIIATANGGIEDSITFLNQIIDYEEGRLTPTNFVQSTYNAIAGQIGMIAQNKGYNVTHVHRGQAFENALLDAALVLKQYPTNSYLVGGVDEISARNHHMEAMDHWYKVEPVTNIDIYKSQTVGTIPGEGAGMFVVNNKPGGAVAYLKALKLVNTTSDEVVQQQLKLFLQTHNDKPVDLFITGENGDNRLTGYYQSAEKAVGNAPVARFKHITGEFQTALAAGLWIATRILQTQQVPAHMLKSNAVGGSIKRILFYNNYKGMQHSFMLVDAVG